jgi:uncharacterized protein YacL
MNIALAFTRFFFFILSIFFMTTYMVTIKDANITANTFIGIGIGVTFGILLILFDVFFKRYNLRSFNIAVVGLFIGYLMGLALDLIFSAFLDISALSIKMPAASIEMIKIGLFLFGAYLGTIMTLRSSDELYISIPFVKFTPMARKKKDLIIDGSSLSDSRIIDLAASGIVDHHLIIPRFIVKDLYAQSESTNTTIQAKAKKRLETLKKLEEITELELRYNDTDFPEIKDQTSKLVRLARLLDANLLTADLSRVEIATVEGIRIINLNTLSNALKPLTQTGEILKIKIQRYGKEPRQGVGYLEDGTMVVVNGGGEFIGENITAHVLSVKHTSSGRMIFCNADEEEQKNYEYFEEEEYEHE